MKSSLRVLNSGSGSETSIKRPPRKTPLRVAFVHSPNPLYADTQNYGAIFMPVWAYTLAAHIPDNMRQDIRLYDTRVDDFDQIPEADVFLFSGINQDYESILRFHQQLKTKYPNSLFLVGGPICWSFHTAGDLKKLQAFDHVVIGDGEELIGPILQAIASGEPIEKVIDNKERFAIGTARPFYRPFLDSTVSRYYGAVLEVSRGCPFLCEFCDIRVLPDNNRSHNKSPELIVQELDHLTNLGVKQVLLACDNFIGELRWAEQVVDAIIAWSQRTGRHPSLYTWLTINFYKHPQLMRKMREAGFDMLFIGIESFSSNSLLETAKVQNTAVDLVNACRTIQSHGFIIVSGLIFGFDSDRKDCFDITLKGLAESGLISGDPSLLTALPGTPLFKRMKSADRLRDVRYGLGGYKYQTNIKYLMPREKMIAGFRKFVTKYTDGEYQYTRLFNLFESFKLGNFVPLKGTGYGDMKRFALMLKKNPAAILQMSKRLALFARRPRNMYYALRGLRLAIESGVPNAFSYWQFWVFAWTNAVLKYAYLSERDFDIDSVPADFDIRNVLPEGYEDEANADEDIPDAKIKAQRRTTSKQLRQLVGQGGGD